MRTSALDRPDAPLATAPFSTSTPRAPLAARACAMLAPLTPPPTPTPSAVRTIDPSSALVAASPLAVLPGRDLLRDDPQHHALRGTVHRPARRGRALGPLGLDLPDCRRDQRRVLYDLAAPADHHAVELGVVLPGLDHHRDLRVAAGVQHFL